MRKADTIDFAKLLGFDTVTRELSEDLDFQDETLGASSVRRSAMRDRTRRR